MKVLNLKIGFGDLCVAGELSFELHKREIIVVAGPNGAGKSTLLKTIGPHSTPACQHRSIRAIDTAISPTISRGSSRQSTGDQPGEQIHVRHLVINRQTVCAEGSIFAAEYRLART